MTVKTFVQPNFTTTDSNVTYKIEIDSSIQVLNEIAGSFAPHEAATPDMTVLIDAGRIYDGTTFTLKAQQTTTTITAPVTNPRIDRIAINKTTGLYNIIAGSEAASPVPPSYTSDHFPVCQVALVVSQTSILNANITDERPLIYGTGGSGATNPLEVGVDDTTAGVIEVYGHAAASTVGGKTQLYTAADHDTTYEYYHIGVVSDDLIIGREGETDITLNSSGNTIAHGAIEVQGAGIAGNARGTDALCIQSTRSAATQVASGANSVALGSRVTASSVQTVAVGYNCRAVANGAIAIGANADAPNNGDICIGEDATAVGAGNAVVIGRLGSVTADSGMVIGHSKSYLDGQLSFQGSHFIDYAQTSFLEYYNTTTDATATELFLDGGSARAILRASTTWGFIITMVGRQTGGGAGTAGDSKIQVVTGAIKRDASNNTALIGTITTVSTHNDAAASGWTFSVTADDTNEALKIEVTGEASKDITWLVSCKLTEIGI
jgi:hypothetical protein